MALQFSPTALKQIETLRGRYPTSQAAILPVLHLAQEQFGHLSDAAIELVAATLSLEVAHVWGVVTFYTMFHREPTGKHVLMVCTNVSCMLRGGNEVLHALETQLGCKAGGTSSDGEFTIIEEECLAACADAPCMISGERYFLRLTPEAAVRALEEVKKMPADHAVSRKV